MQGITLDKFDLQLFHMDYRVSKSREEINKRLKKKFESSGFFTVWQKADTVGIREFVVEAKLQSVDPEAGIFTVIIPAEIFANAKKEKDFYFLLQGHDFAFKSRLILSVPGELRFKIPKEIRIQELRMHPRIQFEKEEKVSVDVTFHIKKPQNSNSLLIESRCPVLNVSLGGICIVVSKETLSLIDLTKEIHIADLTFFESLKPDMKAVIRNARVYIKKGIINDEYYALGLQFNS